MPSTYFILNAEYFSAAPSTYFVLNAEYFSSAAPSKYFILNTKYYIFGQTTNVLNKIAPDKWKHLIVGIGMGMLFQFLGFWFLAAHMFWATGIAFGIVVGISYGWELLSKITGMGHYEIMDAVFSIAGGIVGMGMAALMRG